MEHYYYVDYLKHIRNQTDSRWYILKINNYICNLFVINVRHNFIVINSSPYFGSHGGFSEIDEKKDGRKFCDKIFESFSDVMYFFTDKNILSINIIENPMASNIEKALTADLIDRFRNSSRMKYEKILRNGFIKKIEPSFTSEEILSTYHQKTRNAVRKNRKSNIHMRVIVPEEIQCWDRCIDFIADEHKRSILLKQGNAKTKEYFHSLRTSFGKDRIKIVSAEETSGSLIAACLFFQTEDFLEYWTPVVTDIGREVNALHGIIDYSFNYMVKESISYFNFGGTWESQEELARFKFRFGAYKLSYFYHNLIRENVTPNIDLSALLKSHKYYYFWRDS